MDKQQKKKYREAFEQQKPKMGIVALRNVQTGQLFMQAHKNIEAWMNRARFMLRSGVFEHGALQQDWKQLGEGGFAIEVMAELELPEDPFFDENKALKLLEEEVEGKLVQAGERFYNK